MTSLRKTDRHGLRPTDKASMARASFNFKATAANGPCRVQTSAEKNRKIQSIYPTIGLLVYCLLCEQTLFSFN
jgi:hypothetical protein